MPCISQCSSTCNKDSGHTGPHRLPPPGVKKLGVKSTNVKAPTGISENVLLCSACRVLERTGYDFDENPALSIWWDKHKKKDNTK